jgi:putative addiction module component (TIGR02574 family)
MSKRSATLLAEALQLPEADRAEIVEGLLASLDAEDAELAAELDRRHAEFLADPTAAVPWSEVKAKGFTD